jgi:Ni/Fe-hydrogenase subunit HybB-like protein
VVTAAILVDVAMFLERYFIVVTGLRVPLMPYEAADYGPTFVEWSIFAAGLAVFCLLITVALKIFPMLAIWEMTEEHAAAITDRPTEEPNMVGADTSGSRTKNDRYPDAGRPDEGGGS